MKLLNNFEQISRRTRVLYVGSVPRLRPLSKSTLSLEGVGLYTSPTRARFEDPCQDIFRSSLEPVEKVLRDAKIDKSNGDTSEKTRNLVVVDVAHDDRTEFLTRFQAEFQIRKDSNGIDFIGFRKRPLPPELYSCEKSEIKLRLGAMNNAKQVMSGYEQQMRADTTSTV